MRRAALLVALALLVAILLRERRALAANFVGVSEFEREGGVYFAPSIDIAKRVALRTQLADARRRVAAFYGPLRAKPTIIAADAGSRARFMTGSTGETQYRPGDAVMVLAPAGHNVDVLAHELAHAELLQRLGYLRMTWCVPTWFDEGLAVYFDQRPFYRAAAYAARRRAGARPPPLLSLDDRQAFFAGSRDELRFRYASARHAIEQWLAHTSPSAATRWIDTLRCDRASQRELARIAELLD
jgi:hypothetical protein